ncbi:MAG: kynurenine formamidase [Candidatus Hydrogenedentota bacterium]
MGSDSRIHWVDVTIPMFSGMTVWPGDPPFTFEAASRIARGDSCNVSTVSMSTHTGTHVDAPWHFEENGRKLHEVDTAVFFGDALLLEFPDLDIVRAADLPSAPLPPRVLFKTRNSDRAHDAPFDPTYVALADDSAQRLVDDGVRLVGVDYLSVAPFKQPGQPTHHILLRANVFVIEGLLLKGFEAGVYPFVALPLAIHGADGAPCRAFIGVEDGRA